jgi:hypothetical protein
VFHRVRPGRNELAHELGFLAWEAIMLAAGLLLVRAGNRGTATATSSGVRGCLRQQAQSKDTPPNSLFIARVFSRALREAEAGANDPFSLHQAVMAKQAELPMYFEEPLGN